VLKDHRATLHNARTAAVSLAITEADRVFFVQSGSVMTSRDADHRGHGHRGDGALVAQASDADREALRQALGDDG
jgi:hypothetical protein